jgi:hypothetical protein
VIVTVFFGSPQADEHLSTSLIAWRIDSEVSRFELRNLPGGCTAPRVSSFDSEADIETSAPACQEKNAVADGRNLNSFMHLCKIMAKSHAPRQSDDCSRASAASARADAVLDVTLPECGMP